MISRPERHASSSVNKVNVATNMIVLSNGISFQGSDTCKSAKYSAVKPRAECIGLYSSRVVASVTVRK